MNVKMEETFECRICLTESGPSMCEGKHAFCRTCWDEWVETHLTRALLQPTHYSDVLEMGDEDEDGDGDVTLRCPCCRQPISEEIFDFSSLVRRYTGEFEKISPDGHRYHFTWVNGHLHGPVTEWWHSGPDSPVKESLFYKYGKMSGLVRHWHENGSLSVEAFYFHDKMHGDFVTYHENGCMKSSSQYKHGKMIGPYRTYYEDGTLCTECIGAGDVDVEEGIHRKYHPNGQLASETEYSHGEKHGLHREWSSGPDHKLVFECVYQDGEIQQPTSSTVS